MPELILYLPRSASWEDLRAIARELNTWSEVREAGEGSTVRAVDPPPQVWVELERGDDTYRRTWDGPETVGLEFIERLFEFVRQRGFTEASLEMRGSVTLSMRSREDMSDEM